MSSLSPVQKHMNLSLMETEEADDDFTSDPDEPLLIATRLYPTLESDFFNSFMMPIEVVFRLDYEIERMEYLHFAEIRTSFASSNDKTLFSPVGKASTNMHSIYPPSLKFN
jgi:hypothetical protein